MRRARATRRLRIMPEMWSGWGLSRGRGPLDMLGFKREGEKMGRLRRRCCQDYAMEVSPGQEIWGRGQKGEMDEREIRRR
jgi:hypothetical protein